jgi:hypothetical protein
MAQPSRLDPAELGWADCGPTNLAFFYLFYKYELGWT